MGYSIDNNRIQQLSALELLANQVVEGTITGLHKSPFHGFSVEFAEHRQYNAGESTRHIDWKLYGTPDSSPMNPGDQEILMFHHPKVTSLLEIKDDYVLIPAEISQAVTAASNIKFISSPGSKQGTQPAQGVQTTPVLYT